MPKVKTRFVCAACGYVSAKWLGKCPGCGEWNTLEEEVEAPAAPAARSPSPLFRPQPLSAIRAEKFSRFSSGIAELDNVLGGGVVPASLVLIGGDPGMGKSTLLTQVAGFCARERKVLYVSAEESAYQVKLRCDRLGISEDFSLLCENDADEIAALLRTEGYGLAVVDSVQAVYTPRLSSASGSVGQIRECANVLTRAAKASGTAVFLVGHVTKEGAIAGPKVLEHIMDTVLYFEGEATQNFKILRAVKNRFGSTNEVGLLEMTEQGIAGADPARLLLSENRGKSAGAVATPAMEGSRCMMVELQALTVPTVFGLPRRMSLGLDHNKLALLLAVLEKRGGVRLSDSDVYLNVMGGIRVNEPSFDLAALFAVVSAAKNIAVPKETAVFGEVGLTGEIRAVSLPEKRIKECVSLGFERVVLPKSNLKSLAPYKNKIELIPVSHLYAALKTVFGE